MKFYIYLIATFLFLSCSEKEILVSKENEIGFENINLTNPEETTNNYLFTNEAKNTLKERFETNYITGSGFTSDFKEIKDGLSQFLASPSMYRPIFGSDPIISSDGKALHMTALYAYAMDDVEIANVIAEEILNTFINNSLADPFWTTSPNFSTDNSLFIQSAKIKKLKDSYYLTKDIQNTLTDEEHETIKKWLSDYKDLVWAWAKPRFEGYWGKDWQNVGFTTFFPEGLYPSGVADPYPLKDSNGNNMVSYGMSWAQNSFNNRAIDNIAYLHSWAVTNEDLTLEHYCREYFKNTIRYGVFSDGTFWELIRNTPNDNTLGVFYTNVSLTGLVYMAHIDALHNHFPDDKLYDFKTTEGILNGSTNLTVDPYLGGSTSDCETEKSLKTLIIGQSKYLRNSLDGGWNDIRFNNNLPMSTVNKRQNSVIAAIANLYYKDQNLSDYYLYNTAIGYPNKVTIYEGWGFIEDYGAWGNFIIGGAWMEQETNFF